MVVHIVEPVVGVSSAAFLIVASAPPVWQAYRG